MLAHDSLLISNLAKKYEEKLDNTKTIETIQSKQSGTITQEKFKVISAKPIIDEIDRVLAKHYGFTDEELDFIINYDIKYRMGLSGAPGDEETDDEE